MRPLCCFFALTVISFLRSAHAAPPELPIWPGVAPGSEGIDEPELSVDRGKGKGYVDRSVSNVHRPTITVHLPEGADRAACAAMVICPGGGLTRVVIDKEGHDLAKLLVKNGVAGIVLKFRTAKSAKHYYGQAAPVADVQRAIRLVRAKAAEWKIDPKRVGVFGFSAGGYLSSAAATRFDDGDSDAKDPVQRQSSRPDFAGMAYPLISVQTGVTREHYQKLFLGDKITPELLDRYSNELLVTKNSPPAFLCHAEDDRGVSVKNSQRYAAACKKAGVPCETFIRAKGGHGYGIRKQGDPINEWPEAFLAWLRSRGYAE